MHTAHSRNQLRQGEEFVYRGHNCRITYNGIRPRFTIDGQNAEKRIDSFEVTPEDVGKRGWDYNLMKAIDRKEGDDPDSQSYIHPRERETVRSKTNQYINYLADVANYKEAHKIIRQSTYKHAGNIRSEVTERAKQLMEDEVAFGLQAFNQARTEVLEEIIAEYPNTDAIKPQKTE